MVPALRDGDVVLAAGRVRGGRIHVRPGDVVLARYRSMPDRLVVKRAVRPEQDGGWLSSDNPYAGGSSAVHGIADVTGRVILRWSGRRLTRVPPAP